MNKVPAASGRRELWLALLLAPLLSLLFFHFMLDDMPFSRDLLVLKSALLLAGSFVFAAGLSMIQFLPAWELYRYSTRAHGLPFAEATCWSFYPLRLVEFLWPNLWGLPWAGSAYWGGFMTDWCFSLPWKLGLYLGLWPLLAVAVGAGPSKVVFVYRPQSYLQGRAVSLATLGLGLATAMVIGIKRGRKNPA